MIHLNAITTTALMRALDLCALRHEVYAANVANAAVPNYQRLEVAQPTAVAELNDASVADLQTLTTQQTVQLDQELSLMTQNALRYELLLTAYSQTTGLLKLAVHEGKGV